MARPVRRPAPPPNLSPPSRLGRVASVDASNPEFSYKGESKASQTVAVSRFKDTNTDKRHCVIQKTSLMDLSVCIFVYLSARSVGVLTFSGSWQSIDPKRKYFTHSSIENTVDISTGLHATLFENLSICIYFLKTQTIKPNCYTRAKLWPYNNRKVLILHYLKNCYRFLVQVN